MTNHPITPPPELVQEWTSLANEEEGHEVWSSIATQAAQWGADQELEACCEWSSWRHSRQIADQLRDARRPKPSSLKEQALEQLDGIATCFRATHLGDIVCDKIRKALEAL